MSEASAAADGAVVVYSSESALRSPRALAAGMFRDLVRSKGLAWRLLIRNLQAEYRQSMLGYIWALLPPLMTTALWVYLASTGLVRLASSSEAPYPVYVMTGTLLWQLFVDAINAPIRAVTTSQGMLAKVNFPREALILAAFGELTVNAIVRALLFLGLMLWFGVNPTVSALLAPLGVGALLMLGIATGMLLVPLASLYQDVGRGVTLVTQLWLYATPVVYPVVSGSRLNTWNPVSPVLITTRSLLIGGSRDFVGAAAWVTVVSFTMLMLAWLLYRIAMPFIIERMPS